MQALAPTGLDVIVIGAGVGGATAALQLARLLGRKSRILLVERNAWPRTKVCGCCLNAAALDSLDKLDIRSAHLSIHGAPLTRVVLRRGKLSTEWAIPRGLALPRATLDDLLVQAAINTGVVFRPMCSAVVVRASPDSDGRALRVRLRDDGGDTECAARLIIVADGLGGSALDALAEFNVHVQRHSWIGLGATVENDLNIPSSTIGLHIGRHGYVGIARLRHDRVNIAAAIDPGWLREVGGPGPGVLAILDDCGVRARGDAQERWKFKGTPALTRWRSRVAAPGLIALGDAAGYVEPFTGEGMACALAAARAAAELIASALLQDSPAARVQLAQAWQHWHDTTNRSRQQVSRLVRAIAHRPLLARSAVRFLATPPWRASLAARIAKGLAAPYSPARGSIQDSVRTGAAA